MSSSSTSVPQGDTEIIGAWDGGGHSFHRASSVIGNKALQL